MERLKTLKGTASPCKDCTCRHRACHDTCDKYKDYIEARTKEKEKYAKYLAKVNPPAKVIAGKTTAEYRAQKGWGK